VDAGAIARRVARNGAAERTKDDDAIARAIRAARLSALHDLRRKRKTPSPH
jgi:hypothetical protein